MNMGGSNAVIVDTRSRVAALEAERVPDAMILESYQRSDHAIQEADQAQLQRLLSMVIRRIVRYPTAEGSRGGRCKMRLTPTRPDSRQLGKKPAPKSLLRVVEKNGSSSWTNFGKSSWPVRLWG